MCQPLLLSALSLIITVQLCVAAVGMGYELGDLSESSVPATSARLCTNADVLYSNHGSSGRMLNQGIGNKE